MPQIKDVIVESNPWWKENLVLSYKERDIYKQIQKFLPLQQIIAITGLRRVGKTTLMFKIIQDYLAKNFNPQNIIYFSFDEFKMVELRDILSTYEEIFEKNIKEGRYLLLLDEIQKLNYWEEKVKRIYDTYSKNIKIIISGSESLFIRKHLKETLAGRMYEFKVDSLTFKEFLNFKNVTYRPIELHKKELKKLFEEFFLTLGFPEIVGTNDKDIIKKYVKESIVEKIVYKDIPTSFGIKDISVIQSLLDILMEEPGQIVELSGLANELKISRQTLSNYLFYLESSFLIRKLYNYSRSRRKVERKLKKYYPAIISVDLLFKEDDYSRSKVFEWTVVSQLKPHFFWRDPYKNEVDVVLFNKEIIPIEIKYGKVDLSGIRAFMKKFNVNYGYILTIKEEREERYNNNIISILPAFKFFTAGGF